MTSLDARNTFHPSIHVGMSSVLLVVLGGCMGTEYSLFWMDDPSIEGDEGLVEDIMDYARSDGMLDDDGTCTQNDLVTQTREPVQDNVLVVLDTSITKVPGGESRMVRGLEELYATLPEDDWELKLISSDPELARNDPGLPLDSSANFDDVLDEAHALLQWDVDGLEGLDAAQDYLASKHSRWIVPGTETLATIFISGDDYAGGEHGVNEFVEEYRRGGPQRYVSSIVDTQPSRPGDQRGLCRTAANFGGRYLQATEMLDGHSADVCGRTWAQAFEDIGARVPLMESTELSHRLLGGPEAIEVEIDGGLLDAGEFWYEPEDNRVHFGTIPPPGSVVSINYPVECEAE